MMDSGGMMESLDGGELGYIEPSNTKIQHGVNEEIKRRIWKAEECTACKTPQA